MPLNKYVEYASLVRSVLQRALTCSLVNLQLYRLTDEELTTIGMTEENVQRLRCVVVDERPSNEDLTSSQTTEVGAPNTDAEVRFRPHKAEYHISEISACGVCQNYQNCPGQSKGCLLVKEVFWA